MTHIFWKILQAESPYDSDLQFFLMKPFKFYWPTLNQYTKFGLYTIQQSKIQSGQLFLKY